MNVYHDYYYYYYLIYEYLLDVSKLFISNPIQYDMDDLYLSLSYYVNILIFISSFEIFDQLMLINYVIVLTYSKVFNQNRSIMI